MNVTKAAKVKVGDEIAIKQRAFHKYYGYTVEVLEVIKDPDPRVVFLFRVAINTSEANRPEATRNFKFFDNNF